MTAAFFANEVVRLGIPLDDATGLDAVYRFYTGAPAPDGRASVADILYTPATLRSKQVLLVDLQSLELQNAFLLAPLDEIEGLWEAACSGTSFSVATSNTPHLIEVAPNGCHFNGRVVDRSALVCELTRLLFQHPSYRYCDLAVSVPALSVYGGTVSSTRITEAEFSLWERYLAGDLHTMVLHTESEVRTLQGDTLRDRTGGYAGEISPEQLRYWLKTARAELDRSRATDLRLLHGLRESQISREELPESLQGLSESQLSAARHSLVLQSVAA